MSALGVMAPVHGCLASVHTYIGSTYFGDEITDWWGINAVEGDQFPVAVMARNSKTTETISLYNLIHKHIGAEQCGDSLALSAFDIVARHVLRRAGKIE